MGEMVERTRKALLFRIWHFTAAFQNRRRAAMHYMRWMLAIGGNVQELR
jgi:hypothetical protein